MRIRLNNGLLSGYQEGPPNGKWSVELPDGVEAHESPYQEGTDHELVAVFREELMVRNKQLEAKDEQIRELHVLLQQAQAALPAPKVNRRRWRFW